MERVLWLLIFCSLVSSCSKTNLPPQKISSDCFDTTFINTGIPGLQAVCFLNGKDGFVSTYNGGLYKTTDSAKTWTKLNSTVDLPIFDIGFIDLNTGFAVGGQDFCGGTECTPPGGFILKTTDGGQSWNRIFTPTEKVEISSMCFVNSNLGFCVGDNIIFKTTDGGKTWNEYQINNLGGKMMQIYFMDSQKGYIACLSDKIVVTNDGGSTWQVISPNRNIGYYSVSGNDGFVYVSGQGKIIKSTNRGKSWNELQGSPADIFRIHFINENVGFAFGRGNYSGGDFGYSYGSIYCTVDGGNTWKGSADIKETGLIQSVSFPSNKIGYAISGNMIIRLTIKHE